VERTSTASLRRSWPPAAAFRRSLPQAIPADQEIEAVLTCSSTSTHAGLIVQAAQAGKHIFCEKPIDVDLSKVDATLAAVQKAGVKLQIGFNRRFGASFARVRQSVISGQIGRPQLPRYHGLRAVTVRLEAFSRVPRLHIRPVRADDYPCKVS